MSDPEWAPYFMNYKFLKKRIKEIKGALGPRDAEGAVLAEAAIACAAEGDMASHEVLKRDISSNTVEKEFFRALHFEVKKASDFFVSAIKEMEIRFARVQEGTRQIQERITVTDDNFGQMILRASVNLYKDLVMLENFAVMTNYGFSKILKKHDKNSGFVTREKFMANILRKQPFVNCEILTKLLLDLEALFNSVSSMCSDSEHPSLTLENEQRLFLEVVMDLKSAAINMCADEEAGCSSESGDCIEPDVDEGASDSVSRGGSGFKRGSKRRPGDVASARKKKKVDGGKDSEDDPAED